MSNNIYMNVGTASSFKETAGTVLWTPKNVATGAGRISAQLDLGASPRPRRYRWTLSSKFQNTPTVGAPIRLYVVRADTAAVTYQDGQVGVSDAALSSEALIQYGAKPLGPLLVQVTGAINFWSGEVEILSRYVSVALWNASGQSLTNVAGDHEFILTPVNDQVQ